MTRKFDADAKINRIGDIALSPSDPTDSETKEIVRALCQLGAHLFAQLERIAVAVEAMERGQ